jgi:DNA-directed RNA polymerase subunit RPC12/RpoP
MSLTSISLNNFRFCVSVYFDGELNHYVDSWEESQANWMRLVRCAADEQRQNLEAFQHDGQIFYKTIKDIQGNGELLLALNRHMTHSNTIAQCQEVRTDHLNGVAAEAELPGGDPLSATSTTAPDADNTQAQGGKKRGKKFLVCSVCSKHYSCKSRLESHMFTHTGLRPYKCPTCGRGFTQSSSLMRHVISIHTGEKPYVCPDCGKGFVCANNLKVHAVKHTGERSHSCEVCSKSFFMAGDLKLHMKNHQTDKPHKCPACDMSFLRYNGLATHMVTHTGERKHACPVCKKLFSVSSNLKVHMRIHSGEKPFVCKDCGRTFRQAGSLANHIPTHTGDKPYTCPKCGRGFIQLINMTRHLQVHK